MQRKRKDDTDRFMQAIAAFSAAPEEVTSQGRRLRGTQEGALHAILAEIDETVLRRRLVFSTGQDATLAVDVGERRLLTLLSPPERLDQALSGLVGRPLEGADAAEVIKMLSEFAPPDTPVFVVSHPSEDSETDVYQGLSAKILLEHQQMTVSEGLPDALLRAVEGIKPDCDGLVICRSGQRICQHGGNDLVDKLAVHLSKNGSGRRGARDVTLWRFDPSTAEAVLVAVVDDYRVAVIGTYHGVGKHFRLWQDAVAL